MIDFISMINSFFTDIAIHKNTKDEKSKKILKYTWIIILTALVILIASPILVFIISILINIFSTK